MNFVSLAMETVGKIKRRVKTTWIWQNKNNNQGHLFARFPVAAQRKYRGLLLRCRHTVLTLCQLAPFTSKRLLFILSIGLAKRNVKRQAKIFFAQG
jgi:hypothetical protein